MASTADDKKGSDLGKNIMMAGLVFQVVSLTLFATAAGEFGLRVWKGKGMWNERYLSIVNTRLFKSFLIGMFLPSSNIT